MRGRLAVALAGFATLIAAALGGSVPLGPKTYNEPGHHGTTSTTWGPVPEDMFAAVFVKWELERTNEEDPHRIEVGGEWKSWNGRDVKNNHNKWVLHHDPHTTSNEEVVRYDCTHGGLIYGCDLDLTVLFYWCDNCLNGQYRTCNRAGRQSSCTNCGTGKYNPSWGTGPDSCQTCDAGKYQPFSRSTRCYDCSAGTYSANAGSASCTPCPAGKYQPNGGRSSCSNCPAGKYSSSSGSTSCASCQPGYIQPNTGQTGCVACEPGTWEGYVGMRICEICPSGTASGTAASSCSPCEPGWYAPTERSSSCTQCPAGHQCPQRTVDGQLRGAEEPTMCPANTFAAAGAGSCTPCPSGKFSAPGSSVCIDTCPEFKTGVSCDGDAICLNNDGDQCNLGSCYGPQPDVTGLCNSCGPGRAGAICEHKVCRNAALASSSAVMQSWDKAPRDFDWSLYEPEQVQMTQKLVRASIGAQATVGVQFAYRPVVPEIAFFQLRKGNSLTSFKLDAPVDCDTAEPASSDIASLDAGLNVGDEVDLCLVGTWKEAEGAKYPPAVWGDPSGVQSAGLKATPEWCGQLRVEFQAQVDVVLTDLSGTPISNAEVVLKVVGQSSAMPTMTTPGNGKISAINVLVPGLPAGTSDVTIEVVSVTRPGFEADVRICPTASCAAVADLVPLNTVRTLDFKSYSTTLQLVDVTAKQLGGTVMIPFSEESRCPVEGAVVKAVDMSTDLALQETTTDDAGAFEISVPLGSSVRLEVTHLDHEMAADMRDDDSVALMTGLQSIQQSYTALKIMDVTQRTLSLFAAVTECGFRIGGSQRLTLKVPSCQGPELNFELDGPTEGDFLVPPVEYSFDMAFDSGNLDLDFALDTSFGHQFPSDSRVADMRAANASLRFVYQPEPEVSLEVTSGLDPNAYRGNGALPTTCGGDRGFDYALESGRLAEMRFTAKQQHGGETCEVLPSNTTLEVRSLMASVDDDSDALVSFVEDVDAGMSVATSAHRVGPPAPRGDTMADFVRLVTYKVRNPREWPDGVDAREARMLLLGRRALASDTVVTTLDEFSANRPLLYLYAPPVTRAGAFGSSSEATVTLSRKVSTRTLVSTKVTDTSSLAMGAKVDQSSNVNNLEIKVGGGNNNVDSETTQYTDESTTTLSSSSMTFTTPAGLWGDEGDMVLLLGSVAKFAKGVAVSLNATTCEVNTRNSVVWGDSADALLFQSRADCKRQLENARETMLANEPGSEQYQDAADAEGNWMSLLQHWENDRTAALSDDTLDISEIVQVVDLSPTQMERGFNWTSGLDPRDPMFNDGEVPEPVRPRPGAPAAGDGRGGFGESLDGANARMAANKLFMGAGRFVIDLETEHAVSEVTDYHSVISDRADYFGFENVYQFGADTEFEVPLLGFITKAKFMSGAYHESSSGTSTYTETTSYTASTDVERVKLHTELKEYTSGDELCTSFHRSPYSGTFVYGVCGGRSSCPFIPGTDARQDVALQLVEAPEPDQTVETGRFVMRINTDNMFPQDSVDLVLRLDAQSASFPVAFKIGSATLNQPFQLPPVQGGTNTDVFVYYERLDPDMATVNVVLTVFSACDPGRTWELPVTLSWGSACPQVYWDGDLAAAESTWTISSLESEGALDISPRSRTPIGDDMISNVTVYMRRADLPSADWLPLPAPALDNLVVGGNARVPADQAADYLQASRHYHLQLRSVCRTVADGIVRGTSRSSLRLGLLDTEGPKLVNFFAVPRMRVPARRLPVAELLFDEPLDCLRPELAAEVTIENGEGAGLQADAEVYCSVGGRQLTVTVVMADPVSDATWSEAEVNMAVRGLYDLHGNLGGLVATRAPTGGESGRALDSAVADGTLDGGFVMPKLVVREEENAGGVEWALPSRAETEAMMMEARSKLLPSRAIPSFETVEQVLETSTDNKVQALVIDEAESSPSDEEEEVQAGPSLAVGLAAGGAVLLAGAAVAIRRRRRQQQQHRTEPSADMEAKGTVSTANPIFDSA